MAPNPPDPSASLPPDPERAADPYGPLLRKALDEGLDPVYGLLPDGRICYANQSLCRKLGYTRDELKKRILNGQREITALDPKRPPPPLFMAAWAGIIKDTRARDLLTGNFEVTTQVEHHYFDWKEARNASEGKYFVSPRGEGAFTFTWESRRKNAIATTADVDQYAAPGKMVVVYGIPKSVDSNGVITLNYRFMRIIEPAECNFYTSNYGRAGEAVKSTGK